MIDYILDNTNSDEIENDLDKDNFSENFEEIYKQYLTILNEVDYNSYEIKNHNVNFRIYYLLKNTVVLCQDLLNDNTILKSSKNKLEIERKLIHNDIIHNQEISIKHNELKSEFNKLIQDNEKLNYKIVMYQDSEIKLKNEIKELKNKLDQNEKLLKIIGIEKEEIINKSENLELNYDLESKRANKYKKIIIEKDREIITLNKNLDDLTEKYNLIISNQNENYSLIEESDKDNNNYFSHNTYSSKIIKLHHQGSLNNILDFVDNPELNENKIKIDMTPKDVIRRMSKTKDHNYNYLSTQSSKTNFSNNTSFDIYKEFFHLTFQSHKLNSENHEIFLEINQENLYSKIQSENIPFHKFNDYIQKQINKKQKDKFSLFGKVSEIYI